MANRKRKVFGDSANKGEETKSSTVSPRSIRFAPSTDKILQDLAAQGVNVSEIVNRCVEDRLPHVVDQAVEKKINEAEQLRKLVSQKRNPPK